MTRPLAALALLALGAVGCTHPYAVPACSRPDLTGCAIESVVITGNHEVSADAITSKIATAETEHPLGVLANLPVLSLWDRLTLSYETLDRFVLERDLARVERIYKARGFYEAHARAGRVQKEPKGKVRVEIVVDEGDPVKIHSVRPVWAGGAPTPEVVKVVRGALREEDLGKPFDEDQFEDTKHRLRRALTNAGYAYAYVKANAAVDLVSHQADLTYGIETGPLCTFGTIDVTGNGDLDRGRLLQAIHIQPGQPYSTDRIDSAQAAVSDLRVVGSVEVESQVSTMVSLIAPTAVGSLAALAASGLVHAPIAAALPAAAASVDRRESVIPITFHVSPTTLKTLKLGLGAEVGSRVEVHATAGWDNRNFLGGLRHFSAEIKPGVVINPLTLGSLGSVPANTIRPLPEVRLHAELAQPGFVEPRTRGLLSAAVNLYQLLPTETLGYFELAGKAGVEREWWGSRVHVGLFANMVYDKPIALDFSNTPFGACGYNELLIPYGQAVGVLDLRYGVDGKRDQLNTHAGFYLANDVQLAGDSAPGINSTKDLKIKTELRGYIPFGKKVVLALRAAGGLLYTFGGSLGDDPNMCSPLSTAAACVGPPPLTHYASQNAAESCSASSSTGTEAETAAERNHSRYVQLLQLRGFTSGGPSSNRGYAYNGVGPQEVVRGISPYITLSAPFTPPDTASSVALLPIATGGKALWELSVELRFPLYDALGGVLFVEGSDVRREIADFAAPFAPHLSTGFGLRYLTPVGALRADFGVRVPGAQVIGQNCPAYDPTTGNGGVPATNGTLRCSSSTPAVDRYLSPQYGQAGSIFGLPLAVSLAIGEAF